MLYVGRFVAEKGIKELLEAFTLLDANKYVLTLISPSFSDVGLSKILKNIQRSSGNVSTIRNPGIQKIAYEYRKSDLCILPSVGAFEQMPLVYLESLACGTPMIISNKIIGVTQIQKSISNDLILPNMRPATIASYIQKYFSLPDDQKYRIMEKCRQKISDLTWTNSSSKISSLIRMVGTQM